MRFRTEIEPLRDQGLIDHSTSIVMVGSCFTDEIGARLQRELFSVEVNPFGTLYNPESMAAEIEAAMRGEHFSENDLFADGPVWRTFRRHSRYSLADRAEMLDKLNTDVDRMARVLSEADLLIATFGSAIAFRNLQSGKIVANCHKVPSERFVRESLSAEEIVERWRRLLAELRVNNPKLKVILTVSPVRHAGYGLVADRLSKSTLILACHSIAQRLDGVIYFPSYEIMVDDLRDYRFYKEDLVHPTDMAVSYIHDIFMQSFASPATANYAARCEKLTRRLGHRMPDGPQRREFIADTLAAARTLAAEYINPELILSRFQSLIEYGI